jgi:NAD(P)-dependent dehydrogenase (short-subunit alcohol dehydrogenase family)
MAITGASSGIGLETAIKFANKGWIVYAGTRQLERDKQLHAEVDGLHFVEMEVTDPDSLNRVFEKIDEAHGRLDLLFCNAGYGFLRALGQASFEDIRKLFDTNVYGVMHAIRGALPLLRKASAPHIVATTSVGGLVGQPFNELYCASKFAVEGLLESLATYYKPLFNIDVTLLEPGAVATNFNDTVLSQIQSSGGILNDEYKELIERYIANFQARTSTPQTAEAVADVMLSLVEMETKPVRLRTSAAADAFTDHKISADPTGLTGVLHTRKLHLGL